MVLTHDNFWERIKARKLTTNLDNIRKEVKEMAKGKPKRDGSGGGTRNNQGRGGCSPTRGTGQGSNTGKGTGK